MKQTFFFFCKFFFFSFVCVYSLGIFAFSGTNVLDKGGNSLDNISNVQETATGSDLDFLLLGKDFKLTSFLKSDLTNEEKSELLKIIQLYVVVRDQLSSKITQKISTGENVNDDIKLLLNEKKEFYKSMLIYIDADLIKAYLNYISDDITVLVDKKDSHDGGSGSIVESKIDKIEGKIIEHSNALDIKFKSLMEDKINENIEKLTKNVQFQSLSIEQKNNILDSLIKKIDTKLSDINAINHITDPLKKQKEVYTLLNQKLFKLKSSFKSQ